MNKHKSNKIKENSNTVRHLIMGQIITTQNLVATKVVRLAGQWPCSGFLGVFIRHMECYRRAKANPQMAALLALCEGNPPATGWFPHKGPVTREMTNNTNGTDRQSLSVLFCLTTAQYESRYVVITFLSAWLLLMVRCQICARVSWWLRTVSVCQSVSSQTWWRHKIKTLSSLLALWGEFTRFPSQSPLTRSFDVFFDIRLN